MTLLPVSLEPDHERGRERVRWWRQLEYREACADWAAERRTDAARNTAGLGAITRARAHVGPWSVGRRARGIPRRFRRRAA